MTPEEGARIAELLARSDELGPEPPLPEEKDEVIVPSAAPPPPPEPKRRARLYDPRRRGYMRATREEGIGDELKQSPLAVPPSAPAERALPSNVMSLLKGRVKR